MMGVSAPLLVMGMTGGYEFLAAEIIHENTPKVTDKTIAFVEGATHVLIQPGIVKHFQASSETQ